MDLRFRAWDHKEKKWLLGYDSPTLGGFSLFGETVILGEWGSLLWHYINSDDHDTKDLIITMSTGLRDVDNKLIYDGDLLNWVDWEQELTELPDVYQVTWLVSEARFALNCFRNGKRIDPEDDIVRDMKTLKLVGNVFENSKLLKENND